MNRRELVAAVAAHTGLDGRDVDKALRGTTEVIEAVAAKGGQVTIMGFAKFARVDRPARMARNPATGAAVKVKASKKAKITPLKGFKDAVMSPSAAPKLAKGVWLPASAKAAPAKKTTTAASTPAVAKKTPAVASKAAVANAPPARATTAAAVVSTAKAPTKGATGVKRATPKKR
ncbi:MAG: HU family DNA-binding protein [Actinobacteria bacterium]|nr:HU family DNA-binding protein [Actinomycetota bacterium]